MYKILGKRVAEYPGIAKPESQRKEAFYGILIVAFKKTGRNTIRYKKVMKGASGNQGRRVAISMITGIKPHYIAVMRCDGIRSPEIIMEKGDKKILDAYLTQTRQDNPLL